MAPSNATSPTGAAGPANASQILTCANPTWGGGQTMGPKEQKQLIGEKIFQHIEKKGGDHMKQAGKITGMLLEMESSALINLLHQPEMLDKKIDQAADVLKRFQDADAGKAVE